MAWTICLYRSGAQVFTGVVEDAELVAQLKLLAEEMRLRVEISEMASGPNPNVSDDPEPPEVTSYLKIPESWKRKPRK